MKFVIIGLSVTSSWGNGHATTYRALIKQLDRLGHQVLFLEKDVPWYSGNRDLPNPEFCRLGLYASNKELWETYAEEVRTADVVMVGSYVQQGVQVGNWVIKTAKGITAFYDIDTPVTMAKLERNDFEYLSPDLIQKYDLYLSFSGGNILDHLMKHFGSPAAKALYCSVDPDLYFPEERTQHWKMGYLGTYSDDRQPGLEELLNKPAASFPEQRFVVAGPQYPEDYPWSSNVERIDHIPPHRHREFYNSQTFTLNITREDMIRAGYSPSVRLFEAAACGVPVISDYWEGLETIFVTGKEILIATDALEVQEYLRDITGPERIEIGKNARLKVLELHSAEARAKQLDGYVQQILKTEKI